MTSIPRILAPLVWAAGRDIIRAVADRVRSRGGRGTPAPVPDPPPPARAPLRDLGDEAMRDVLVALDDVPIACSVFSAMWLLRLRRPDVGWATALAGVTSPSAVEAIVRQAGIGIMGQEWWEESQVQNLRDPWSATYAAMGAMPHSDEWRGTTDIRTIRVGAWAVVQRWSVLSPEGHVVPGSSYGHVIVVQRTSPTSWRVCQSSREAGVRDDDNVTTDELLTQLRWGSSEHRAAWMPIGGEQ